MDIAKSESLSVGQMVFMDGDGKARVIIGDLSPGVKTMGYQDEQACTEAPRKQNVLDRLDGHTAALVHYAERAGRSEAQVHFVSRELNRSERKADRLEETAAMAQDRAARQEQETKYWVAQAQGLANEVGVYERADARRKAAAKKTKKPAAKKTVKKSK
jgi:hypothetical protein